LLLPPTIATCEARDFNTNIFDYRRKTTKIKTLMFCFYFIHAFGPNFHFLTLQFLLVGAQ